MINGPVSIRLVYPFRIHIIDVDDDRPRITNIHTTAPDLTVVIARVTTAIDQGRPAVIAVTHVVAGITVTCQSVGDAQIVGWIDGLPRHLFVTDAPGYPRLVATNLYGLECTLRVIRSHSVLDGTTYRPIESARGGPTP